jgi:hypothetical protein
VTLVVHAITARRTCVAGDQELTGLARGGQRIKSCKDTYVKSLDGLIKLASLQVGLFSRVMQERESVCVCVTGAFHTTTDVFHHT